MGTDEDNWPEGSNERKREEPMNAARDVEMEPYTTPQEWLEGKRRLVRMLRQLCADASGGARARREPPRCDREVLEAALNWYESRHSLRLSLTHAAGSRLPMDDFAEEMGLDSVEREVVDDSVHQ